MINDIYTYISENISGLTGGTNLFKSRQSERPNNQVVIYDTGGLAPDRYVPTAGPTFQVLVRNTSYANGKAIVDSIVDLLHSKENVELVVGETYFYYIFLLGEAGHIGRDDKGRHEWSINFVCKIRR
jgi:hypothetical protein